MYKRQEDQKTGTRKGSKRGSGRGRKSARSSAVSDVDTHDGIRAVTPEPSPDAYKRQIFCNVELNGNSVEAVGFDMDFTLAQYNNEFNLIAFEGAKRNLVNNFGYPEEVMDIQYNENDFRRGLIIDKNKGNILKVDRHRYVRKAYHGVTLMPREDRKLSLIHI